MLNSSSLRVIFISLLLIAIYIGLSVHTALFAPISVTEYLFSEAGAYEVFSPWLWYLLAIFCLCTVGIYRKFGISAGIAAILLGLREMDFHKKIFETSFIKTNFYRSVDIPIIDKIMGFLLLLFIGVVFVYLFWTYFKGLKNLQFKESLSNFYILLTIVLTAISKILDRLTSQLNELFHIQLLHSTSVIITTIEESTEMLLPVLLIIALLTYYQKGSILNR